MATEDRYAPLRTRLEQAGARGEELLVLGFDEVEGLVGALPPPAATTKTWWLGKSSAQARAWGAAGWRVDTVGFAARRVAFRRAS